MRYDDGEERDIRRRSDGSVDVEYYVRLAQAWRRESLRQAFAAQGQAFDTLLNPIRHLLWGFVRIVGVTIFESGRWLAEFCRSLLLVRAK